MINLVTKVVWLGLEILGRHLVRLRRTNNVVTLRKNITLVMVAHKNNID